MADLITSPIELLACVNLLADGLEEQVTISPLLADLVGTECEVVRIMVSDGVLLEAAFGVLLSDALQVACSVRNLSAQQAAERDVLAPEMEVAWS